MADNQDEGIMDKTVGRAKKTAGDITGNESLKGEGTNEERKGEAKEDLENAKDDVANKAEEVSRRDQAS
jgi:uncharacterized protein YjbJ (UPF0337 family)